MTTPDAVEPVSDDVTSEQYSPIAVAGEQENLPVTVRTIIRWEKEGG
jgi:hypothetical protein